MKRKFLSVLFALSMLVCIFALSACKDEHEHTFTNYVSDNNATCTEDGTETAKCDGCDATDTKTVPGSAKHTLGAYIEEVPATCTQEGVKGHYTCSACNKNFDNAYAEIASLTIEKTTHIFADATCTAPKTCSACGAVEGSALGHAWVDATCTEAKHCSRCTATEGEALGHTGGSATCKELAVCTRCNNEYGNLASHAWDNPSCTVPRTCTVCGKTEGAALNHDWVDAACTEAKHCSRCTATEGEALGHTGGSATCKELAVCTRCNNEYGNLASHTWNDATCTAPKTCSVCSETEGEALGHTGGNATCENHAVCERCHQEYGSLENHSWVEATCTKKKHCSVCEIEEGELLNHTWVNATCAEPKHCSVCQKTEGSVLSHVWDAATCTAPKTCSLCQEKDGLALGHAGGDATCKKLAVCTRCNEEYGDLGDHTWSGASCNNPDTCSVCGLTRGTALTHDYQNYVSDENATCEEDGTKTGVCIHCGAENTITDEGTAGHRYGNWIAETAASCSSEGEKAHYPCTDCTEKFDSDYNVIEDIKIPITHAPVTDEAVAPNCTDPGLSEGSHCSLCDATLVEQRAVPATGHTEAISAAVAPSCTDDGLTAGKYCSVCNLVLETQVTDPKLGHNTSENITKNANCTEDGTKVITCSRCDLSETQAISKLGHTPGTAATCTEDQKCTVCHAVLNVAHGHDYETLAPAVTAPTCLDSGYTTYKCHHCGDERKDNYKNALGHDLELNDFLEDDDPDVRTEGCKIITTYNAKCPRCDKNIQNTIEKTEHKQVTEITVDATCQSEGTKKITCSNSGCNYTNYVQYTDSEAHKWEGSGEGVVTQTCSLCGATKKTVVSSDGNISSDDLVNSDDVTLDNANISMDNDVKDQLKDNGDTQISVSPLSPEDAADALKDTNLDADQLANLGTIYDFKLTNGGGYVTTFDGYITIRLPYDIQEGEDVENIAVYYIDDDGNLEIFQATYADGFITFKTKHFSKYVPTRLTPEERCAKFGHTEKPQTKAPTCTEDGYRVTVCTRCGVELEKDIIPALPHSYVVTSEAEAGCVTHGYKEYTCVCGDTRIEKTAATGHSYTETGREAATCRNHGYIEYTCQGCQSSYLDLIPQLEHSFTKETKNATCTAYGFVKSTCQGCGAEHTTIIPATGHKYEFKSKTDATCTRQGYTIHECSECQKQQKSDYVPASGHNYEEFETVAATCRKQGYTVYKCSECYNTYRGALTPVTAHSYIDTIINPTCETEGYTSRVCEDCGHKTTSNTVAPNGHSYNSTTTNPSCTTGGFTKYTCSECQHSYIADRTPALGHSYERFVHTPTCDENGYTMVSCSRCGNSYTENETAPLGHDYVDVTINATCTTGGHVEHTCGRCNDFYIDNETDPLNHSWIDATCTEAAHCYICGLTDGEALGHIWVDATCTKAKYCSECNIETGDALGHNLIDATCTEAKHCSRCDYKVGEALGHTWVDATCTAPKTCSVCQATDGEPLGHTWVDATCTTPKTCSVCQVTEGEALGHTWVDATCTAPKTCSVCQVTEGDALGHNLIDATCTEAKHCSRCDYTVGEPLGHTWVDATCTAPKTCSVCKVTDGDELGHSFENGTCTVCGVSDGTTGGCTHELTKRTYVNLTDYGVCGGYFYILSCECGENKTIDMEDGNTEECEIDNFEPEQGVDENGNYYMKTDVTCPLCHTNYYTYMTGTEEGCVTTINGTVKITAGDGRVILDCPVNQSEEYHSSTDEVEVPLSEFGITCGGTISYEVCNDCGKPLSFWGLDINCPEDEFVMTQNTNVSEDIMDDESLMEIGVLYYMEVIGTHSACGIEAIQYMSAIREDACRFLYKESFILKVNGVIVIEITEEDTDVEHDCEYSYEFLGEGNENDCSDGVMITESCKNCQYSGTYKTTYHGGIEYSEHIIDACEDGMTVYIYTCPCGKSSIISTTHESGPANSEWSTYTDNDGVSHDVNTTTYSCGIIRVDDSYTVNISSCLNIRYTKIQYIYNDELVFEATEFTPNETHSYTYKYTFHGEINCEAGYDREGTCKYCEKTIVQTNLSYHDEVREVIDLHEAYGMCEGSMLEIYSCACKEKSNAYVNLHCKYGMPSTETFTDGDGVVHTVRTITCMECGVVYKMDVYNTITEVCEIRADVKHTFIMNGKTVEEVFGVQRTTQHTFKEEYKFSQEGEPNCEDGVEIIYTCTVCGDSHSMYTTGHHTKRSEELLENETCGNITIITNSCPCGRENYVEIMHKCNSSYHDENSYVDNDGITHYLNIITYECGIIKTTDSYEVYNGCYGTRYVTNTLTYNKDVIYENVSEEELENHSYLYEYRFHGEINCEAGYDRFGTCSKCGSYVEEFDCRWHQMEDFHIDLSEEYGACDGVYIEGHTCACGYFSVVNVNLNCSYTEKIETLYFEDGMHTIVTLSCESCGLVYTIDTYNYVKIGCDTTYNTKHTVTINGAIVKDVTARSSYTTHNYIYEYKFISGEENCESGVSVTYICNTCGHSYESEIFYDHRMEPRDEYYECMNGESIRVVIHSCPCGKLESAYAEHGCKVESDYSTYRDNSGNMHEVTTYTYSCGLVSVRDSYVVFNGCIGTVYNTLTLTSGDSVIFEKSYTSKTESHVYEYEYYFHGERDCEAGYDRIGTCSICGDTVEEKYLTWHIDVRVEIQLDSEYGACAGSRIEYMTCPCGKRSSIHFSSSCNMSYETQSVEDESGNVHFITTRICDECGLVYTIDEYISETNGCIVTKLAKCTFVINGVTVKELNSSRTEEIHNYTFEYRFHGEENCDYGYDVIRTCLNCKTSFTEENHSGHSFWGSDRIEIEACSKGYIIYESCPCGDVQSVNYVIPCCTYPFGNHTSETFVDELGVTHNISRVSCDMCGTLLVIDSYNNMEEMKLCTNYVLSINGNVIFDETVKGELPPECIHSLYEFYTAPTCTEYGRRLLRCTICGYTEIDEILPALGHSYNEDGVCTLCGTSPDEPGCHHSYVVISTSEATCYMPGCIESRCQYCNITKHEDIPALGHSYIATTVEPSCENSGYIESRCQYCNITKYEDIPAIGHAYGDDGYCSNCGMLDPCFCKHDMLHEYRAPTCTRAGYDRSFCNICGYSEYDNKLPAIGHSYGEDGVCANCGLKEGEISPSECKHNYQHEHKEPTCTENGYDRVVCVICKYVKPNSEHEIPSFGGHNYDENGVCTMCGTSSDTQECIHNYIVINEQSATCDTPGFIESMCQNCNNTISETIPATGHKLEEIDLPASCEEDGYYISRCVICQYVDLEIFVPAFGHFYDENGICKNCGMSNGEITPPECSHEMHGEYQEATCTEDGYKRSYCVLCKYVEFNEIIPAFGHSFENGICTICLAEEGACTHELVNRTYINLADYGVCGGYFYLLSCECGENQTMDMEDGSTEACRIENAMPEEGVDEEGNPYMIMDATCPVCGTRYYVSMTAKTIGCYEEMSGNVSITAGDGTVILDCPVFESYESHRNTEHIRLDFADYGVPCGGYVYHTVCRDCNAVVNFDMWSFGCPDEEFEILSTNTNLSDDLMNDESLMEIGVLYFMEITRRHPACGLTITEYMSAKRLNACETEQLIRLRVELNGEVIFEAETENFDSNHSYNCKYTFDGEANCESGVTITNTCTICGDSYSYTSNHHSTSISETITSDACANLIINTYRCPCGIESHVNINHGCPASFGNNESYVDEAGNTHNIDTMTYSCGIISVRDSYSSFNGCYGTVYTHITLTYNGNVIYEGDEISNTQIHDFEYVYKFHGEIDCEAGYDRIGTCTNCGEQIEEKNMYWHHEVRTQMMLDEYGACPGSVFEQYSCACGKQTNTYINLGCKELRHELNSITGDDGIVHEIITISCDFCGIVYTQEVYNTTTSGCETTSNVKHTIIINGMVIKEADTVKKTTSHYYREEYIFYGDVDCEAGYDVLRICDRCGESYTEYGHMGHSIRKDSPIDLTSFGACGGMIVVRSCACGRQTSVEYGICGEYSSEYVTDENGVQHFIERLNCSACGAQFVIDGYTDAETGKYITSYVLYMNGSHMFSQTTEEEREVSCNHRFEAIIFEPTCTSEGYTQFICMMCKEMYNSDFTPALAHSFADGVCQNCGLGEGSLPEICNHSFVIIGETAPGCDYMGMREVRCDICQVVMTESIPPLGHTLDESGVCVICGVLMGGSDGCKHEFVTIEENPACEKEGYKRTYCVICKYVESDIFLAPLSHNYSADGRCEMCGATEGSSEYPTECAHILQGEAVEPTCTIDGYKRSVCVVCGCIEYEEILPAFGHIFTADGVCMYCNGNSDYKVTIDGSLTDTAFAGNKN